VSGRAPGLQKLSGVNRKSAVCAILGNADHAVKVCALYVTFFCKYWAYLCNIYTITFGSTRRLQMPNFYNVIMFTNKHRFNLTSFFEFVSAFFQTGITNEVEITRPNALKRQ